MTPQAGNEPATFEIVVVTTAEDLDETFNAHQPLRVVFERALTLVGGHGQPDQFTLQYNDQPLALDRTIGELAAELGWPHRVELELVPKPVVV
jgi:hypothetical protein